MKCLLFFALCIFMTACSLSTEKTTTREDEESLAEPEETEDYTSKVPFYTFATTLEEQEEQLKTNPLLLRMIESRKQKADDPHRPIYHYVNPEGNLNDPNGLCFWKGQWHLFYQAFPPEDTRQHWGHAISDDLIHWRDLPYAIYPNPEYQCFSGSALAEDDRVIAMYHGTRVGNMVAVSSDPLLLNWQKVSGKAVIPSAGPDDPYAVFDPCIWEKDGMYYSLSGGRRTVGSDDKLVRANFLFRSKDLAKWEYMHHFVEEDMFTRVGDDGACPYFWPIGNKYILPFFSHTSGGQYLLGDYDKDRDKFVVTNHGNFNFEAWGPGGVHAPSAAPDGEGGVIIIFNMNPGKPTEGWNQIMSLPRQLTMISENTIGMEPAGNIESLRYDHQELGSMTLPANQEIVLENINGNAMEIIAEIDLQEAQMIELNVLRSPNKEEFTKIAFFKDRGKRQIRPYNFPDVLVYLDVPRQPDSILSNAPDVYASLITIESSYSSILPEAKSRAPETGPIILGEDEMLKLRVFVDKSVVEVFVNGRQCVAQRVYPGLEGSTGVSLRAQGSDAELLTLNAWQMKSIY